MEFAKAYQMLLKGKKIRRKDWERYMCLRLVGEDIKTYKGEYTEFYDSSNILLTMGWFVLDGDGKELIFIEALDELKQRKKVSNKKWVEAGEDIFIFVDKNQLIKCRAIEFQFMPSYVDLISTDWEEMK